MLHNDFEIRVLVKGRPINEYHHNGQTFLEGRDGSNFEIEFINRSPSRVEAVISVDGLSVIDGKDAGPDSSGYLVEAYGNVRIPGWKLTDEQVAAFQFAGKKKSYAQQSTGSARNTGVLGALVFAEKPVFNTHSFRHYPTTFGGVIGGGVMRGMVPTSGGWVGSGSAGDFGSTIVGAALNNVQPMGQVSNNMSYSSAGLESARASITPTSASVRSKSVQRAKMAMPEVVEQTLGTGFGEATQFATTAVEFNRGDLAAMIVLYYDDSRGLRARGIELTRPSRQRLAKAAAPQAFPGMNTGCNPPPGWNG